MIVLNDEQKIFYNIMVTFILCSIYTEFSKKFYSFLLSLFLLLPSLEENFQGVGLNHHGAKEHQHNLNIQG